MVNFISLLYPASVSGPCCSLPPTAGSGVSAPTHFCARESASLLGFPAVSQREMRKCTSRPRNSPFWGPYRHPTACHTDCHTPVIQIVIQVVILLFASRYAKRELLLHALSYQNLNVICNARIRPQPIPCHVQPRSAAGMSRFPPSRTVLRNQSQLSLERHTSRWHIGLVAEENSSVVYQLPISRCMIKLSHCLSLRCCF